MGSLFPSLTLSMLEFCPPSMTLEEQEKILQEEEKEVQLRFDKVQLYEAPNPIGIVPQGEDYNEDGELTNDESEEEEEEEEEEEDLDDSDEMGQSGDDIQDDETDDMASTEW